MLGAIYNTDIKPLVIFGAGASYDLIDESEDPSFAKSEYRPPLSDNLFDTRSAFKPILGAYPRLQGLIGAVRKWQNSGLSLEDALDKMQNEPDDSGLFAAEIAVLHNYLGVLFRDVCWNNRMISGNNYHTFFRALRQVCKEFCVVNFNYDYLAQKALSESLGVDFSSANSYVSEPIKFIHPHGSIMWEYYADKKIKVNSNYQYSNGGSTLIMPTISGKAFSCPGDHIEALLNFVKTQANVIIVIGWKGREDHFSNDILKSITGCPRRIIIVGGGDKASGKAILKSSGLNRFAGISRIYISGFSNLLKLYPDFNMEPPEEHLL